MKNCTAKVRRGGTQKKYSFGVFFQTDVESVICPLLSAPFFKFVTFFGQPGFVRSGRFGFYPFQ